MVTSRRTPISPPPAPAIAATPPVGVVRLGGQFLLVAARDLAVGERILLVNGMVLPRPSRHTIQVGIDQHVDMPPGTGLQAQLDEYPWRFLNHSCAPNAAFRGRELVALRAIPTMQEIAFDYNTTEWAMDVPFCCCCGARNCLGEISGYRALGAAERRRRSKHTAPHLLRLAAEATAP